MENFGRLAAHALEAARQDFAPSALAYITQEIEARCEALGLTCRQIYLQQDGRELEATATFDLSDESGVPMQMKVRAQLITVH